LTKPVMALVTMDKTTSTQAGKRLRVQLVYALPDRYWSARFELPAGADVEQALAFAKAESLLPQLEIDESRLAIFSRPAVLSTLLHDGDRIELLRPLQVDPKQSRRDRAGQSPSKKG